MPKLARGAMAEDAEIGKRVRERRISVGMTQTELSAVLGVSFQQVQKYEQGQDRLTALRLATIANVLAIDIRKLLPHAPLEASHLNNGAKADVAKIARQFAILDPASRRTVIGMAQSLVKSLERGRK